MTMVFSGACPPKHSSKRSRMSCRRATVPRAADAVLPVPAGLSLQYFDDLLFELGQPGGFLYKSVDSEIDNLAGLAVFTVS